MNSQSTSRKPDCPEAFRALLARLVQIQGVTLPVDDGLRMEVLGHILERYQHPLNCRREERLPYEQFLQCGLFVDTDRVVLSVPERFQPMGSGIAPIQYQVPLLNFLLAHYRRQARVIDIIDEFIAKVWDQLKPVDFKQTKTGATRCYTNVRFAATVLRGYGLLKFTKREAFKTWELSLPGILVAAHVSGNRPSKESPWKIKERPKKDGFELSGEIEAVWAGIAEYPDFVKCLAGICAPDATVFKTFEKALKQAHDLLRYYGSSVRNHSVTNYRRRELSLEIIDHLETKVLGQEFYEELSACICINDDLERAALRAREAEGPPAQGKLPK
jgi:hypothetical protein